MSARAGMLVLGLAALGGLAGCESTPTAEFGPSRFVASVAGSVAATYEGRGHFHAVTPPAGLPRPATFRIFSSHPDVASREVQSFILSRLGSGLPAVGTYPLGPATSREEQAFRAVYHRSVGAASEQYVSTSGEVVITASSAERIEGTFRFVGARSCTGPASRTMCAWSPASEPVEGPTVEVTGSFVAVPGRPARDALLMN